jgi:hypothetical protein
MGQNDPVINGPRYAPSIRRRAAAALAATAVLAVSLLITLDQSAVAAPAGASAAAAAAPVTTAGTAGQPTLSIDPASGFKPSGGAIKVVGAGFDTKAGLYVAICHVNGSAPPDVKTDCVGGPIPLANTSKAWAHITSSGVAVPGQVSQNWNAQGGFSLTLTLPASDSSSDALDCSKVVCAVITTPDAETGDTSQNLSIPITYAAATSSTSSTPTTPTTPTTSSSTPTTTTSPTTSSQQIVTSTIAVAGTTVQPKTIGSPSVVAGGKQQVLFAGFAKNEVVTVTLYSDPIKLPDAKADSDGIVDIEFTVPADLPAGTHLLRAVGQTSKVTGVASFQVTAPVVVSTSVASSAAASSTPATTAAASSAAVLPIPVVSSAVASSSAAPSGRGIAVVVVKSSGKSRLVWPWYVLGAVVLLWVGLAIFMVQRRRKRLADENREKERILAEASAAEQQRAAQALAAANSDAPTAYIGPVSDQPEGYLGYHPGEHGLLSGRDHPDNPGMMSGRGEHPGSTGEQPTTYLPPAPGADQTAPDAAGPSAGPPPNGSGGPPTGAWTPDFTTPPATPAGAGSTAPQPAVPPADATPGQGGTPADSGGPGTSQWQPNFDDDDPDEGGSEGGRHSR